jgi:hypothetical protein
MVRIVPGSTPSPAARKDQDGKASTGDGAGTESLPPSALGRIQVRYMAVTRITYSMLTAASLSFVESRRKIQRT